MSDKSTDMQQIRKVETPPPSTVAKCIERLHHGATVVVETQRLKHLIEDGYNRTMLDRGEKSWPTAEVYVWNVWLAQLWHDHEDRSVELSNQLLTSGQSMQLWEKAIATDIREQYSERFEYLLWHINATAIRAKSAYGLMCAYGIDSSEFGTQVSQDTEHFLNWLESYRAILKENEWVDLESLPDVFIKQADEIFEFDESGIVFAGFDQWTPQHQNLLEMLSGKRITVEIMNHESGGTPAQLEQIEFNRVDDEIDMCARWARAVIEANPSSHRVGIVAPRLEGLFGRITRKFSGLLNPDLIMEKRQTQQFSFHVTLGTALGQTPLVVDALNLIELIRYEVDVSALCSVILSDRVKGWDQEQAERARLAEEIRSIGKIRISINDVVKVIKHSSFRCAQLKRILESAQTMRSRMPKYADYPYWGNFFMDWMKNFQSEIRENREFGLDEKQAHESWVDVVGALAELGFVSSKVGVETAIAKLTRLISEVKVQPRAIHVPVQVGGMLAMAGQSFTHLWMLGMNNEVLPGTPRPNPFIPVSLQKENEIPGCSAQLVEKSIAQRIDWLMSSAVDVVQSYAVTDGSTYFQPSSQLQNLTKADSGSMNGIPDYQDYSSCIARQRNLCETFTDWKAAPVNDPQLIRGGSSIIRHQSLCSFRAFAEHRLNAGQTETVQIGISPIDRGLVVHRMFEALYAEISSNGTLSSQRDEVLYMDAAKKHAQQAIEEFNANRLEPMSEDLAQTEVNRLVDLARQWLSTEKKRPNFVVWDTEREVTTSFGKLPVRMRIDRIDKVEGHGLVIIDYKTGQCNINDTIGMRPRDPQLLIYACALVDERTEVFDVAYARLKRGEVGYFPLSKSRKSPGVDLKEWKSILEQIAQDFLDGKADVDPLKGACDYCHIFPICRKDDRSDHVAAAQEQTR